MDNGLRRIFLLVDRGPLAAIYPLVEDQTEAYATPFTLHS